MGKPSSSQMTLRCLRANPGKSKDNNLDDHGSFARTAILKLVCLSNGT